MQGLTGGVFLISEVPLYGPREREVGTERGTESDRERAIGTERERETERDREG